MSAAVPVEASQVIAVPAIVYARPAPWAWKFVLKNKRTEASLSGVKLRVAARVVSVPVITSVAIDS
jgi:hypothetical protein